MLGGCDMKRCGVGDLGADVGLLERTEVAHVVPRMR